METAQRRQTISKLSRIPNYSGGGFLDGLKKAVGITPETPEMKAYKAEAAAARAAAKAAPAPASTPSAPAQAGISGYAGNSSLAAREKAAGLANGSKVKPGMAKAAMAGMGGMLKGPGTPTSDDIPATVVDTGEPIKVATEERIVSKKGNKALEREAKSQGYESLDAKLEALTGIPVGPTLKYEDGTKAGSAKPIQHASEGGLMGVINNGPVGSRREIESSFAGGGVMGVVEQGPVNSRRQPKNLARQRLGELRSVSKKKTPVSERPMAPKRVEVEDPELENEAGDELEQVSSVDSAGVGSVAGLIGVIPAPEKISRKSVPGYSGGGILGEIPANQKMGFGGLPVVGPTIGSKAYASGGLVGEIEKKVSDYIAGTPSYSGGGILGEIPAQEKLGWKTVESFAGGGEVKSTKKQAELEAAFALGAQSANPVAQIPTGGVPGAGPTAPLPVAASPGAFDNTRSIAREAMRDVGEQYEKGNVSGAIGRAARGYAATNVAGLVDAGTGAANAVGSVLRPVGNAVSNVFTGENMGSGAAPVAARPAAAVATNAEPPVKAGAAPAAPTTIAETPTAAARLRGIDGANVGNGVQRFNTAGKSPLFTNMTDAEGMASNEALNNRGPVSAQNQTAMDGIQGRQNAADTARARKAQYDAEVAGAQAINGAAPAYDPEAGARALTDFRSPASRALANLSTRDKNGKLAPGAERMMAEIYKQTLGGPQAVHIEGQRNATTRRGQDMGAQATNAQTQIQRQRLGLETTQDQRAAKQAERAERAQRRIESLYDDYANADDKDKPKLAEQLRVMTGKDKPEQWQAIALQGSTDAMGNKTEGVLAAVNKSTGEMRKLDQGGSGGASNAPMTKADYDKLPKGAKYTHPDGSTRTKG